LGEHDLRLEDNPDYNPFDPELRPIDKYHLFYLCSFI
jgi:hypothetical protein